MSVANKKKHDYHLVDLSAWPILTSFALLIASIGVVLFLHDNLYGQWMLWIGGGALVYCVLAWWRDVVSEANSGDHTPVVQMHHRYGVILFIVSEIMFFVAWFWAYFDVSLFPAETVQVMRTELTGGHWPPKGIITFNPWHLPLINTLILLLSGTTVTWAHHALINDDREGLKWGLFLTVLLGLLFSCFQILEYKNAQFGMAGHIYGSTFYMTTGFHGFHVFIGTIFLSVCLLRAMKGDFTPTHHVGFEAAAWYWHFVDVVWLALFAIVYVWGAGLAVH